MSSKVSPVNLEAFEKILEEYFGRFLPDLTDGPYTNLECQFMINTFKDIKESLKEEPKDRRSVKEHEAPKKKFLGIF